MPVGDFLWCDSDKISNELQTGLSVSILIDSQNGFFYAKGDHQKREKKIVSSYRVCRLTLFEFRRVDIALIVKRKKKSGKQTDMLQVVWAEVWA